MPPATAFDSSRETGEVAGDARADREDREQAAAVVDEEAHSFADLCSAAPSCIWRHASRGGGRRRLRRRRETRDEGRLRSRPARASQLRLTCLLLQPTALSTTANNFNWRASLQAVRASLAICLGLVTRGRVRKTSRRRRKSRRMDRTREARNCERNKHR